MPMLANNNIKGAVNNLKFNYESLFGCSYQSDTSSIEFEGYDIVTTCPSCNLILRKEGLNFYDSENARKVAKRVFDSGEYLYKLLEQGKLNTEFTESSLKVFYHNPCHLKVQGIVNEPVELLRLIPGVEICKVSSNCCGMSGSWGMKEAHFDMSVKIAQKVWNDAKESEADIAVTECGTCKLQIEAGTDLKVIHPIILLNMAYQSSVETPEGQKNTKN